MKKQVYQYEDYEEYEFEMDGTNDYPMNESKFYMTLMESLINFDNWKEWVSIQRKNKKQ